MPILKTPPKQLKNATLQLRIDEDLKMKLDKYATFLDSTESYIVSEALKLVFNKDDEFKEWLEQQDTNGKNSDSEHVPMKEEKTSQASEAAEVTPSANGNKHLFT